MKHIIRITHTLTEDQNYVFLSESTFIPLVR